MKIKVKDADKAVLDWLVAKCENYALEKRDDEWWVYQSVSFSAVRVIPLSTSYKPTENWAQGGPIIEREGITVARNDQKSYMGQQPWVAYLIEHLFLDEYEHEYQNGPTPLIAAMRCYVASKLGEEAEIPEELK